MEIKNALITSVDLIITHGGLSGFLNLDYGNSGQGFGGYMLYHPREGRKHEVNPGYAGHFIFRCMEIGGVDKWDKLVSKTIRVKSDDSKIYAIGHILKDDWFCPSDDFNNE